MPKSWRTCEITQDCKFGFTEEKVSQFLSGWVSVKDYAYIVHDKDKKDDMTEREPHIHLMLRFAYPVKTEDIISRSKRIGMPPDCITENRIEKMKNWSAALNYLTHRDELKPYKHVYDSSCVKSNFDWELAAEDAHQKKQLIPSQARAKQLVELIDSGDIKEYNMSEYISAWEECQYGKQISVAFARRKRDEKLKGERNMKVIFITGPSGVGKDTFAAALCEQNNTPYFRTSNNDNYPFDDYKGQPAIIWSDARDNIYKPQQLFLLLDNHWKSSQKARYSDINLDCETMYITSIKPIERWYNDAFNESREDRTQLYRRISSVCEMNAKEIKISIYNQRTNKFDYAMSLPNMYRHEEAAIIERNRRIEFAKELFGGLAQGASFVAENIDNPDYEPMTQQQRDIALEQFYIDKGYEKTADGKVKKIRNITEKDLQPLDEDADLDALINGK